MDVKANWEKQEGSVGTLTFEVDAASFNKALDQAFSKVSKQVNVPGFRKGKVPRVLFEQRFGVESLYQDAIDIILPEAYSKAIDETSIEPVAQPSVDIESIGKGQPVVFKAEVTVKPEVKLGEYKGLKVEAQDTDVTEEDVQKELSQLQERYAELAIKEDGAAENGDTVVIDFEGFVDGEAFEGGQSENYSLELGSNQFIPGFEEQLVGLKAGEEKDIQVTFPEDYHAEELKGKEATFKVKIHEIKAKQLPELDDEFAKDVDDEVETLDALKEKLEKQLKERKESAAKAALQDAVVEQASANAEINIPEAMIESEVDHMLRDFEQQIQQQGLSMDLYYQFSGSDQNGLRDQMKEDAEKRVRANLTLEAIAKAENIEATDEDVDKEIEKMATMYGIAADQMKQMLAMQGGPDALKGDIRIRKALDFLVDNATSEKA
ncbi:trigger factor [Pullulanibacillus sp. KACC 23026]|uniref:trigger factor n=1 Tax=Pullulanibacillus sp. KACC 23026 TaxID=3028315 RepID=UPI0023B1FDD9|nr:trigger factor [Pullulanibacillus sp. KACC 23026]WEG14029.1 trigger factor [Pullulanibacillus sp. KACC 23026]